MVFHDSDSIVNELCIIGGLFVVLGFAQILAILTGMSFSIEHINDRFIDDS